MNQKYTMFENYHIAAKEFSNGNMEVYGRLMYIINCYGIENIELDDLNPVEKLFFTSVKANIDKSIDISEKRSSAGSKKSADKTSEKSVTKTESTVSNDSTDFDLSKNNLLNQKNICFNEEEIEVEEEIEKEGDEEGEKEQLQKSAPPVPSSPPFNPNFSEPQHNYAKQVFEIFKDAELPCEKDVFQFECGSFYRALSDLRKSQRHSSDVLEACKNYVKVLKDPDCYVSQKMGFEIFVKSKTFVNCLPANFDRSSFLLRGTKSEKPERKKPDKTYSDEEWEAMYS